MSRKYIKKSVRIAKKAVTRRDELPRIAKDKVKNKAQPYIRRARGLKQKTAYGAKLLFSAQARELHTDIKQARSWEKKEEWGKAASIWQSIILKNGKHAPVDAYVRLAASYIKLSNYKKAKKILSEGVKAVNDRTAAVTQATLVEWLQLSKQKAEISMFERLDTIDNYRKDIKDYQMAKKNRPESAPKIAIVSAVSDGYDAFQPPHAIDDRFDYIVYSNTPVMDPGIYDVRPLPYIDGDSTRSARFVKTNITNLLPDYDYVMWIDANILIAGDIYPLFERFMKSGKEFSAMLHPTRTSPYEEMIACIKARKDDVDAILEQKEFYETQGYDTDKLIESNILFYKIKGTHIDEFLRLWWTQIDKFSRRDQFSINYALDKAGVDWDTFTDRPNTSRNHSDFALMDHGKGSSAFRRMMLQLDSKVVDPFVQELRPVEGTKKPIETISAIVCVHNAPDDTRACLDSIVRHREANLDLIIVDDGSQKPAREIVDEYVEKYDWMRLVRHEKALGYTRAASAGLKESRADLSILLNSDTIVTKGWSTKMAKTLQQNKGTGLVGPLSSAASHQSIPDHRNSGLDQTAINNLPKNISVDDMNAACEKWAANRTRPRVPLVHGFCYGIRREVIDAIGYLDAENFPRGYGEENDYCFRAANAGFGLVIATDTYVYHSKSKSFVSSERKQLMEDGSRKFRDLHGQRRISRALKTMQQNPYLQTMRSLAGGLYRKSHMQGSTSIDYIVEHPSEDGVALGEMSYLDAQKELVRLNEIMVDWSKLPPKTSKKKTTVSIIMLVLNNLDMTKRCIESVMNAEGKIKFELIVVDNGSDLETLLGLESMKEKYPDLVLVANDQNYNFALGNNIGFKFAHGEYVVLLNNDTYVTDNWLDELIAPLQSGEASITQSLLLYPAGDIQSAGVVFGEKSPLAYALYAGESPKTLINTKNRVVHAATGACLAISSKDFAKLKGFDPAYINGQEDVDLCLRLRDDKASSNVMLVPRSIVYHDESRTPGRGKYRYENRKLFVNRWPDVSASDQVHYERDGYEIVSWKLESQEGLELGVPIYTPIIKQKR